MARREITQYFDDLDNTPLKEDEVQVVSFSLDGTNYYIDLAEKNAAKLRELFQPYIEAGTKVPATSGARRRSSSASASARNHTKKVREWAQSQGMKVANRGKVPQHIYEEYNARHGVN